MVSGAERGNRKDSRGIIPNRVSIENRLAIVSKRKRAGDIEVNLMMGKNHKGALLVLTDRATYTRLKLLKTKESGAAKEGILACLQNSNCPVHTSTFDNGKAFGAHEKIKEIAGACTCFTKPYISQNKGTVENRTGVIRRFFPKKTELKFVTEEQVNEVEEKINNRPIRKFNYKTAKQALQQKIALIT